MFSYVRLSKINKTGCGVQFRGLEENPMFAKKTK